MDAVPVWKNKYFRMVEFIKEQYFYRTGKVIRSDDAFKNRHEYIKTKPDLVFLRHNEELLRFTNDFTVSIVYFKDRLLPQNITTLGSGVLLRIKDKFFVVTAGHCVKALAGNKVCFGIAKERHQFYPNVSKSEYLMDGDLDLGFIEIPAVDAHVMERKEKIFMSLPRIVSSLAQLDDWYSINGYPGDYMIKNENKPVSLQALSVHTTVSGYGVNPYSRINKKNRLGIDLVGDEDGGLSRELDEMQEIPRLSGVSGGGCWKLNVRPKNKNWQVNDVKLFSIHVGSLRYKIGDKYHDFYRSIGINHFLEFIYRHYPDLKKSESEITLSKSMA